MNFQLPTSAVFISYTLEDLHPVSAPYSSMSQPIPMDMSGDLKIDLFGTLPTGSPDSRFKVWQNVWNDSQSSSPVFNLCVVISPAQLYIECTNEMRFILMQDRPQDDWRAMQAVKPAERLRGKNLLSTRRGN